MTSELAVWPAAERVHVMPPHQAAPKRMRRLLSIFIGRKLPRLLPTLALLSALFSVAAAFLWIDSGIHRRRIAWFGESRFIEIQSTRGLVGFWTTTVPRWSFDGSSWLWEVTPLENGSYRGQLGSGYSQQRANGVTTGHVVAVPLWFIVVLALLLPAIWLAQQIHRFQRGLERKSKGQCSSCGYDLRATPDQCPECGASVGTGRAA